MGSRRGDSGCPERRKQQVFIFTQRMQYFDMYSSLSLSNEMTRAGMCQSHLHGRLCVNYRGHTVRFEFMIFHIRCVEWVSDGRIGYFVYFIWKSTDFSRCSHTKAFSFQLIWGLVCKKRWQSLRSLSFVSSSRMWWFDSTWTRLVSSFVLSHRSGVKSILRIIEHINDQSQRLDSNVWYTPWMTQSMGSTGNASAGGSFRIWLNGTRRTSS